VVDVKVVGVDSDAGIITSFPATILIKITSENLTGLGATYIFLTSIPPVFNDSWKAFVSVAELEAPASSVAFASKDVGVTAVGTTTS